MSHQVESLMLSKTPAWHGLGTVLDRSPSSSEALRVSGLDWTVSKRSMAYLSSSGSLSFIFPNNFVLARDSDDAPLGTGTSEYSILQNHSAFSFADSILGLGATYESAGSLKGGRCVFLLGHLPPEKILGETVLPYFCLRNWHDGSGCAEAILTATRVVCMNTLSYAFSHSTRSFKVRHTGDLASKQKDAERILGLASSYMDSLAMASETLVSSTPTRSQFLDLLNHVWPDLSAPDATPQRRSNAEKLSSQFLAALGSSDLKPFSGTSYSIFQAAADFDSHFIPNRKAADWTENRFLNLLSGERTLQSSFASAFKDVLALSI